MVLMVEAGPGAGLGVAQGTVRRRPSMVAGTLPWPLVEATPSWPARAAGAPRRADAAAARCPRQGPPARR
ncbi:MAG TPA: hypothetical protein VNL16_04400 [Chloroflexota bacterium]|nr:hypothetical protein [Chloroflexota bacterium]